MKGLLRPLSLGIALVLAQSTFADTLRDIYDLALKNDPKLRAAAATFRADQETEVQARSRLLPQIGADASYGWNHREQDAQGIIAGTGTVFDFRPGQQHSELDGRDRVWGVNLTQPLLDLPAWFTFKSGQELSKQAEAQFAYEQQDVIVRVADAYLAVLRAEDNLRASQAEERAIQRQFDQTNQRFDVGLIAITDVHEARAALDASVAQRLTDEGNVASAYEGLTALTGQGHANLWKLNREFPIAAPAPAAREDWVKFALENNYALKAAFYGMEAAGENAEAKRMEHLPKITGSLSYNDDSLRGDQDFDPPSLLATDPDSDTTTKAAMVRLTVPIFTGGYTSSARRQAAEQYNTALERRIDAERTVVQATRSQHIAVTTDMQRVQARSQSIVSAQSALEATQAGYEVGTRNVVDVLVAQRTLYTAARDYANARYDYVSAMLRLKQQAGMLSPQDIYDLDKWLVAPDAPTARLFPTFVEQNGVEQNSAEQSTPASAAEPEPAAPAKPQRAPVKQRQSGKPQQR